MGKKLTIALVAVQLVLFVTGRVLDDLTWYDVGLPDEVAVFESISIACMLICVAIQIFRKPERQGFWRILFFRSQLKFLISWSLIITIGILFFSVFGCSTVDPGSDYFFVNYSGCVLNVTQIVLTNLNYSLICNTWAETPELIVYELALFAEIVYEGNLTLLFISNLVEKPKDYSILLISIIIANQVLIMDLVFRAAYEDR